MQGIELWFPGARIREEVKLFNGYRISVLWDGEKPAPGRQGQTDIHLYECSWGCGTVLSKPDTVLHFFYGMFCTMTVQTTPRNQAHNFEWLTLYLVKTLAILYLKKKKRTFRFLVTTSPVQWMPLQINLWFASAISLGQVPNGSTAPKNMNRITALDAQYQTASQTDPSDLYSQDHRGETFTCSHVEMFSSLSLFVKR